ncbi:hypothetical protein Salat_1451800 [Sesamum alatum]|uniref:DUF4283 domain-containing protein n=1 Tax=Sesamum alatum TaxID=300844 RepID=A0AAE2CLQ4_9LAMI|nr:hypothetical protein Salat_1451800 [Sesamum alatum]
MFLHGFPMRIIKWTQDFNPCIESPIVWIRLVQFSVHLVGITSLIGTLLKLDEATTDGVRPSVTRVCVKCSDKTKTRLHLDRNRGQVCTATGALCALLEILPIVYTPWARGGGQS